MLPCFGQTAESKCYSPLSLAHTVDLRNINACAVMKNYLPYPTFPSCDHVVAISFETGLCNKPQENHQVCVFSRAMRGSYTDVGTGILDKFVSFWFLLHQLCKQFGFGNLVSHSTPLGSIKKRIFLSNLCSSWHAETAYTIRLSLDISPHQWYVGV